MKISVTVKIHFLCTSGSERKFQMGPWGAVYVLRTRQVLADLPKTRRSRERLTVHYCWTEMLYSITRKCQYLCSQHLQACSFDCHTELHSEQRSQKRKRLNFMPTEQKKNDRRPNAIGMKFSLLCMTIKRATP